MKLIHRLQKFIEYSHLSLNSFDEKIGSSNGYIGKQIKREASIGSDIVEKIVSAFPELNIEWLITGQGDMLRYPTEKSLPFGNFTPVPYINIHARSQYVLRHKEAEYLRVLPFFILPTLKEEEHRVFEVDDFSMSPTLRHGDLVVGKRVQVLQEIVDNGIHVLVTVKNGVLVRRVQNYVANEGYLVVTSDNSLNKGEHMSLRIETEDVLEVWCALLSISDDLRRPFDILHRLNSIESDMRKVLLKLKDKGI